MTARKDTNQHRDVVQRDVDHAALHRIDVQASDESWDKSLQIDVEVIRDCPSLVVVRPPRTGAAPLP